MTGGSTSILDGNTFIVTDERGDIESGIGDDEGLFLIDTRFLSKWVLSVDGRRPNLLSADRMKYFRAQFFGTLSTGTIYVDSHLSLRRQRSVAQGFHEDITIQNHGHDAMDVELRIDVDADFADLFEVKDMLPKKGEYYRRNEDGRLVLGYKRGPFVRETWISTSEPHEMEDGGMRWHIHLPAHGEWSTCASVQAVVDQGAALQNPVQHSDGQRPDLEDSVDTWVSSAPRLTTSWDPIDRTYRRSLIDLAALRFRSRLIPEKAMPAAGLPWFMAMFGRDSILTSLQALPFVPELAETTLRVLATLQSRSDDAFRDAEPGKILHELRLGELTAFEERPHSPYYGAADSTPLFLILLDEYERWSGDRALVASLQREARAAVRWIDEFGDRDGDGYVEYERRNAETGLENQCWKDSWDSIAFADGTLAELPRATCEIQGYVYDAKMRTARLARLIWNDHKWAEELERDAEALKERFNRDFWIADRQFFALALDGKKRQVDSLSSNIGHLLWSGIAEEEKAAHCVRHLMGPELYTGWGIRTMGREEGSYNPIGYHVGTVWPHDNSIIAWGLRRYGYREAAARLARGIFEAAECFDYRLPEAFAGYDRNVTRFPVEYPTACSPQAWASGTPLLLLRTLLGLEAEGEHLIVDPAIPEPIEELQLLDIPGRWDRMDAFGRARLSVPA